MPQLFHTFIQLSKPFFSIQRNMLIRLWISSVMPCRIGMIRVNNTRQGQAQEYAEVSGGLFLHCCTASPVNQAMVDCFQLRKLLIHMVGNLTVAKSTVASTDLGRNVGKANMMRLCYCCRENGRTLIIQPKCGAGIHMVYWQDFSGYFTGKHLLIFRIQLSKVMIFCCFFYYLFQKRSITLCILPGFQCILFR